jgi:hypothetical protein
MRTDVRLEELCFAWEARLHSSRDLGFDRSAFFCQANSIWCLDGPFSS